MSPTAKILPFLTLVIGSSGMLISFTFMWSVHPTEIVAAGLAFIAAALLTSAGVLGYVLSERLSPT